jgi:hypothetical protein
MRFFEDGPSIPDELLFARDEGRVVFFCGAGISQARARLPDFYGLAKNVIKQLRVSEYSESYMMLQEARELEKRKGKWGKISADRIFGQLEQEFESSDIESAVAKALKPTSDVDLSAHQILIDLSTTPGGKTRLVTTNFDRLFNECDGKLRFCLPPRLPDPSQPEEMDGIIYIHGCANEDYSGSESRFTLSISEFGRAYLSEGWATAFFKEIIGNKYVVVFVGYSADDPPVMYLLQALKKRKDRLNDVYAFQSGELGEATEKWRDKGVKAISYSEKNQHSALWKSLEAWAERARDREKWYQSVIALARKGPEKLRPHERGQVAHIIKTSEGARKFSEGDSPSPAEWLLVFDKYHRYAKPDWTGGFGSQRTFVDPFDNYGLDSDIVPKKIDPDDINAKRDVPDDAWDAFDMNKFDRQSLSDNSFPNFREPGATNKPKLPSRLNSIGVWISKVADQTTTVWWAAGQIGLHPDIQKFIKSKLKDFQTDNSHVIRKAWMYLFEAWEESINYINLQRYIDFNELKAMIEMDGWDSAAIRKYTAINRPYLRVMRNFSDGPILPHLENKDTRVTDVLRTQIEYPDSSWRMIIPDEFLALVVRELRKNLEYAVQLETEIMDTKHILISPIDISDEKLFEPNLDLQDLKSYVILFKSHFSRLIKLNLTIARNEFAAWPVEDSMVFSKLKIWACENAELVPAQTFGKIIADISDDVYWDSFNQSGLLEVLAKRWDELTVDTRKEIEDRILKGPPKLDDDDGHEFEKYKALRVLKRLTWLKSKGCDFSFDINAESNRLRQLAPEWKPESEEKVVGSNEFPRIGPIKKDPEYSSLLLEPIGSIISKAGELSGRTEDIFVEKDPFAGLSTKRPVRAFRALTYSARRDEYPKWAWETFLYSEARKDDEPKCSAIIAERISRFPNKSVTEFIYPASDWVLNTSEGLASHFPKSFEKVIEKLIKVLRTQPHAGTTTIIRSKKRPDWSTEALNAPVGKIAQAIVKNLRKDRLKPDSGFPDEFITNVEGLLSLDGDLHRHAIVIFSYNLNWFYSIDPKWTETHLLTSLDGNDKDDQDAFWSGFLWGAGLPNQNLYMRLKPYLMALAKEQSLRKREYYQVLVGLILAGWGTLNEETQKRLISNEDMRSVLILADDEFRSLFLWQVLKWSRDNKNGTNKIWPKMLPEFLRDVWPRQKIAKTPKVSSQLCDIAFFDAKLFSELSEIILPFLTKIEDGRLMLPEFQESQDNIFDLYPRRTLAILNAVLPDEVTTWPYNIERVLKQIGEADSSLNSDQRLLELKRKWNAR